MLYQKISEAMINHRQIALAIQRGRRFHKALKAVTDLGPVTREQFRAVASEHKIDEYLPEGYIVAGILSVYELPKPEVEAKEVLLMEPGKPYLAYWKKEPDDEMAFFAVLTTGFYEKANAFARFMEACNLPHYTHCHRCDLIFTSRLGKKYCSDKCRALDHYHSKAKKDAGLSIKERTIRFLKNVRRFIQSL
jgi:hypothetical protein